MDKRLLLDRAAKTADERMVLARVLDKYEQCRGRNLPTHTDFLSPQEQASAEDILRSLGERTFHFLGGYDGAQRRALFFLPDWLEEAEELPFGFLRASFYTAGALNHRDFLGSLMGLGLTREKIGDILVAEQSADIIVLDSVLPFLLQNWTAAGRTHLTVEEIAPHALHLPQAKVKRIRATVMSLRLDSVAAEGFGLSRSKAAGLITAGKVQLDHRPCQRCDAPVGEGAVVSARGLGKFVVKEVEGKSRKGRTFLTIERYL